MNGWYRFLIVGFAVGMALAPVACSKDEPDPGMEPGQQSTPESPQGEEFSLDAAAEPATPGKQEPAPWQQEESLLSDELTAAFRTHCVEAREESLDCTLLRSLVVVETTMALEEIERSRDQRGTAEALEALALIDEPEILVAAMRILGQFPETPGIAEKAVPLLLESPYLQVQEMAARVLAAVPDPTLAALGVYWTGNHRSLVIEDVYQEYPDFAPHYVDMGFPDYPDAEWFSPADSDRSVGWWTSDDFATVSAWLAEELGVEGLDYQRWAERMTQESMAVFQAIDPAKQAEMERLTEEWTNTQDFAVLERLQKLQEELYAPVQAAGEVADQGVAQLGPPLANETQGQVRFFVAEERGGHVARLVIAYPLASLGHTVIQHAWNLADYSGAWPHSPDEEPVSNR